MIRVSSFGGLSNEWRDRYILRTKELIPFQWNSIDLKKSPSQRTSSLLPEEAKFLKTNPKKFWILDAGGREFSSEEFYRWLFQDDRHLVIGPAVGWHPDFKTESLGSISLSKLTFTHSLIHTMLAESIYRSACILKNHPFVK